MFGREDLRQIVEIVGYALRQEDSEIRAALLSNSYYQNDGAMGLRRIDNERCYQYLAWKALASSALPFCVVPERDYRDLWICGSPTDPQPLAIGEMKRFVEPDGEKEAKLIEGDIKKLRVCNCPGFELVTTEFNPKGEDQYQWLAERFSAGGFRITKEEFEIYSFPTLWLKDGEREKFTFALIGFMVTASVAGAKRSTAGQ